ERQASVKEKTKAGIPCVPERLDVEKQTNPFLRFDTPNLKETLIKRHQSFYNFELDSDANLYATLRAWKDSLDKTGILDSGLNE
ncbi:MAG: hydroxyacylglutathione hydrolase C-terminal domain-containing protein, partial [Hydrogenovibrio sp.]|nr:hydroxyacylglutathione hydrolase C-terminal domain-containing protein [Hydrogenovibrio sp.]